MAVNLDKLIQKCIIDDDAIETRPFKRDEYSDTVVIRHKSNNKWFALIFEREGKLFVNLKCPPDLIAILKEQYEAVLPAWHMNKKHWCTVDVDNIPSEALDEIIKVSFNITLSKRKLRK